MSEPFVVGISWRTAPVAIREKLAFRDEEIATALRTLVGAHGVAEALLISTCNRVEVYGVAKPGADAAAGVRAFFAQRRARRRRRALRSSRQRRDPPRVSRGIRAGFARARRGADPRAAEGRVRASRRRGDVGPGLGALRSSGRSVSPSACAPRPRSRAVRRTCRPSRSSWRCACSAISRASACSSSAPVRCRRSRRAICTRRAPRSWS